MLAGRSIVVPNYQRAYSWETDLNGKSQKQVNTFLSDLKDYVNSHSDTPYYFGHFLFEERGQENYAIIDGQQRLTTTVIFISAVYKRLLELKGLQSVKELSEDLCATYWNTIRQGNTYRFSTVEYDNQLFRDYVIDQKFHDRSGIGTFSEAKIADAFDFFCKETANMEKQELLDLLKAITAASCTTHVVRNESEAVQMFIFQNNRGKKPTHLEIIKALFMYHVHLYAPAKDKESLLKEITTRFEDIYKSIAQMENAIDEDSVLVYAIKVFRNNLDSISPVNYVNEELAKLNGSIDFIRDFTLLLESSFVQVRRFLKEEKENMAYHALLVSADKGLMYPFVIKALRAGIPTNDMNKLVCSLGQIFLRHRIIGTRANLLWRLNDCFVKLDKDVMVVVNHIEWMKNRNDWWGFWNNNELKRSLGRGLNHSTAKILLWKYENCLIQNGKSGYKLLRYDDIETPHLEHIAPQTENTETDNGYCPYDDEFREKYLECLGNYLLLSGSHNISLSNEKFELKRDSYNYLLQQKEIQGLTEENRVWNKGKIAARQEKILTCLMGML